MQRQKSLVILSQAFGTNFSGGTSATNFVFERLQECFEEVIFIGKEVGNHSFKNLQFRRYKNIWHALKIIREIKNEKEAIYYGDFYMTYFFILAGVPYYFTYHDNWPEQADQSFGDRIKGLFYIPIYKWIIKKSLMTFAVSKFRLKFIGKYTKHLKLIRNGIVMSGAELDGDKVKPKSRLLMTGNLDNRKYRWAIAVFRQLANLKQNPPRIDIFGKAVDAKVLQALSQFDFVHYKGFQNEIPLSEYGALLCTSQMENLSISVVEALKAHLPVIAFDVGGLSEVIDGTNGRLIAPGDIHAFTNAVIGLSKESFSFVDEDLAEFDWDVTAGKYKEVIIDGNE